MIRLSVYDGEPGESVLVKTVTYNTVEWGPTADLAARIDKILNDAYGIAQVTHDEPTE